MQVKMATSAFGGGKGALPPYEGLSNPLKQTFAELSRYYLWRTFIISSIFLYLLNPVHSSGGYILLYAEEPGKTNLSEAKKENRLAGAASPYLQGARFQPVDWYEFSEEAFALARKLDRPILLDIGAVWCHWCHVMDEESYENQEVAELINRYFIAIKVDRDERPDIDRKYQESVSALTGQGGWPLTAFLTPEGKVFYGGTYFPPDNKWGREGLKSLLPTLARLYKEKKTEIAAQAERHHQEMLSEVGLKGGTLTPQLLDTMAQDMLREFDPRSGGFGSGTKFPSEGAMEFALWRAFMKKDKDMLNLAQKTLDEMALGGIRDHIRGGFFRYSVDPHWHVPHFEKMSYVNAGMIRNYIHAYAATGKGLYKEVVEEILEYVKREASDQGSGGFYASQDADIGRGDDGDYYTWTEAEVDEALTPLEARVIKAYYGVEKEGEMEHDPAKNVLRVMAGAQEIGAELGMPAERVNELLRAGRKKMLESRNKPPSPFVDRNKYVHWNGMMLSAYLEAYKFLGQEDIRDFALKGLELLLERAYQEDKGFLHVYHEGQARIEGLLEDNVQMARACLDAYEVSGQKRYLERAEDVVGYCLKNFWDEERGGFFDLPRQRRDVPRKPFDDIPTPAANAVAAMVLDRLYYITGKGDYREKAQRTLEAYAGSAPEGGHFAASYALALGYHINTPAYAVIIGKKIDPETALLLKAALGAYRPEKIVTVHDPAEESPLPYPARPDGRPVVYVCIPFGACAPPTQETDRMAELIRTMGI